MVNWCPIMRFSVFTRLSNKAGGRGRSGPPPSPHGPCCGPRDEDSRGPTEHLAVHIFFDFTGSYLENSAVATGLEKVSFLSNPKERQCQRMFKLPHNCTYLTC